MKENTFVESFSLLCEVVPQFKGCKTPLSEWALIGVLAEVTNAFSDMYCYYMSCVLLVLNP